MSSSGTGDGTSFAPLKNSSDEMDETLFPCLLQLPDLLGVKKQRRDVDKRKENEVSLQMTMTAKKMRI